VRYRQRASRLAMRGLRASSEGVRVWEGRREATRVKRTSLGVCRREEVRVRIFSGEKGGRVESRYIRAERKRRFRERRIGGGMGVMGSEEGAEAAVARRVR